MKSSLKIIHDSGETEFNLCPSRDCKAKHTDTVYSNKHASSIGWKVTSSRMFCTPDKDVVWVCPDCISDYHNEVENG